MTPSDFSGALRLDETEILRGAAWSVGRYQIIGDLGGGGMARVYLAVLHAKGGFRKFVVLKVPNDDVMRDPALVEMFLNEARLAARLNHQNVVQTYEVIDEGDRPILVMEYLEGRSLAQIRHRSKTAGRTFPLAMHLRVIADSLEGLHHVHELRELDGQPLHLVHRDVSPQNLMVTFDGNVKVLDFGVAKAGLSSQQTAAGTFKGKIRYMSPEQVTDAAVDRRADIFAVGAMIWEAAVGRRLWEPSMSDVSVVRALIAGAIPMPRQVREEVDPRLEAIIQRAVAISPADRYATAADLQSDLEAYLDHQSPRFSTKQVGAYVAELFAEPHSRMTREIETRLAGIQGCSSVRSVPPVSSLAPTTAALMPHAVTGPQDRSMWVAIGAVAMAITAVAVAVVSYSVVRGRDVAAHAAAQPTLTRLPVAETSELPRPLPVQPPEELISSSPTPTPTPRPVPTRAAPSQAAPRRVEATGTTPSATPTAGDASGLPPTASSTTTRPRVKLVEDGPRPKLMD